MKITVDDDRPALVPVVLAGVVAVAGMLLAQAGLDVAGVGSGGLTSAVAVGIGVFIGLSARAPIESLLGADTEPDE